MTNERPMRYYELIDDVLRPGRWCLGRIEEVEDNWDFAAPWREIGADCLHTHVQTPGEELDYSEGGYAHVPFLSERARRALSSLDGIDTQAKLIPVTIRGQPNLQPYYALRVLQARACVDERRSDWYRPNAHINANSLPRIYGAFFTLAIDPAATDGLDLLRIEGGFGYIIASERMKDAFEHAGISGAIFLPTWEQASC